MGRVGRYDHSSLIDFGGKSTIASIVWQALGDVHHYIEPAFGSAAVLSLRPHPVDPVRRTETINEFDGYLTNVMRAIKGNPAAVADACDWWVSELDLHARSQWMLEHREPITERLRSDPFWYDATVAGWWLCGKSTAIGRDWGTSVKSLPHLADKGRGTHRPGQDYRALLHEYAERFRHVRICCGDFERVLGPWITQTWPTAGIFLDPPYDSDRRDPRIYPSDHDAQDATVAVRMVAWAREHAHCPGYRIVVCGLPGEHGAWPEGWREIQWVRGGGFGNQGKNVPTRVDRTECLWLSPQCELAGDERQLALVFPGEP